MLRFNGNKLTVLHIFSGDLWAGAEAMIFNLLSKLKEDSELKIIALSLNEGVLTGKLREVGIETYVIPESAYSFLGIFVRSLSLFRGKGINIIHSHRYKENGLAFCLSRLVGVRRLVTTIHGLPEPTAHQEKGNNPTTWKTKVNYFILKHHFTDVIAVSQEMKSALVREYHFREENVGVIYNGISLTPCILRPRFSPNPLFHIGTVGRMVPIKNFILFLEVAAEIRKKTEKVHFSILGDGPLKEDLIKRTEDLKISDCVEFLSPRPDPFPYYQSLDLYLNTSLHEGIPISILEAMACGKAVIAPKTGGIPEIILNGEEGILVEGREPKEFAHSCLELMENQERRMAMGENSSKKIKSYFDNTRMAQSHEALYKKPCKKF